MPSSSRPLLAPAAVLVLLVAACGGSTKSPTSTAAPSQTPPVQPSATAARQPEAAAPTQVSPTVAPSATPPPPTQPAAPATIPPQPTSAPPPPQASGPPPAVRFDITAQNLSFDKAEVRARAGASITAVFTNKDAAVEHNLTFSAPGLPHGETCTGPCTASQTFTAPAAGRYNFFCNIHSQMIGDFIVEP